jgi:hypothetical protein
MIQAVQYLLVMARSREHREMRTFRTSVESGPSVYAPSLFAAQKIHKAMSLTLAGGGPVSGPRSLICSLA